RHSRSAPCRYGDCDNEHQTSFCSRLVRSRVRALILMTLKRPGSFSGGMKITPLKSWSKNWLPPGTSERIQCQQLENFRVGEEYWISGLREASLQCAWNSLATQSIHFGNSTLKHNSRPGNFKKLKYPRCMRLLLPLQTSNCGPKPQESVGVIHVTPARSGT